MPAIINPMITDAGLAAAIHAEDIELQLAITHISLGTGKYDAQTSGAGMTAMALRKETVSIGGGRVSGTGGMQMTARFLSWEATPYDATELAFWAGDPDAGGVLFAVHSHPSNVLVQRNGLDYVASFVLQLTRVPAGSVTVVIDPDEAQALALIGDHEGKPNPHPQYVLKAGDTMGGPLNLVTPPQFDESKKAVNGEYVNRVGLNYPSSGGKAITTPVGAVVLSDIGRWVDLQYNGGTAVIPKASTVRIGGSVQIVCSVANATLTPTDDDQFVYPGGAAAVYPVVFGETITLVRNSTKEWRVLNVSFRMPAGIVSYFAGNVAPSGWLKLNGVTLSRSAYPALWTYAQSTGGVVTENDWWNNNLSGRFSSGVSGSDFRIPDLRGVFLRALDDGRGIDSGRAFGSYQDHANRAHAHALSDPGHVHPLSDPGHGHGVYDPGHIHSAWTDAQGQHTHGNAIPPNSPGPGYIGVPGIQPGFNLYASQGLNADGNHTHGVGIGANGTGIGIYGNGTGITMGARTTGISVQSDGSEARPRNVAFSLFIKY